MDMILSCVSSCVDGHDIVSRASRQGHASGMESQRGHRPDSLAQETVVIPGWVGRWDILLLLME